MTVLRTSVDWAMPQGRTPTYSGGVSVSVLIVEDEPRTRERLANAVAAAEALDLVGCEGTVEDGFAALNRLRPDVLLTDLGLPDGSGVDLIAGLRRSLPDSQAMVVTVLADERNVVSAIEAGATGYLLKDSTPEEIAAAISELVAGGSPISSSIARYLLRRFQAGSAEQAAPSLSEREQEVLRLVAKGFSGPEIARLLELSPHTVRTHVRHIYEKLEVTSRGEAVYQAVRYGLLEEDD